MRYLLLLLLFTVGCGRDDDTPPPPATCTIADHTVTCPDGATLTVQDGKDGKDGVNGTNGKDGKDGIDGKDGQDGELVVAPAVPMAIETIDPCGDLPGQIDEILLKLPDGNLIAWYENQGLFIVTEGTWQTTDQQHCVFRVDANNLVTWET